MDLEHMLESVKETRFLPDSIARHIVERLTLGDTGNDTYTYLHLLGLVNRSGGSRHMQDVKLIEKFLRYTAPREPCDYPDQPPLQQSMVRKLAVKILGSWLVIEDYFEEVLFLAQDRADPQVAIVAGQQGREGIRIVHNVLRSARIERKKFVVTAAPLLAVGLAHLPHKPGPPLAHLCHIALNRRAHLRKPGAVGGKMGVKVDYFKSLIHRFSPIG